MKQKSLTKEQVAVIETAKSYLIRGSRIQYADTRFTSREFPEELFTWDEYRWESRGHNGGRKKTPEDYTSNDLGYTNCADFTHDVYHSALDFDIVLSMTEYLTKEARKPDTLLGAFHYDFTGKETEEEQLRIIQEYRSKLVPGDIVVVRKDSIDSGHAMLYVGRDQGLDDDAEVIHSTGKNYKYDIKKEEFEEEGTVQLKNLDFYFVKGKSDRYLFDKYESFSIIRPLNVFKGKIPKETKNRIKNLKGIVAEKISSPSLGQTVSVGGTIKFSYILTNKTDAIKTVKITDVIPENCRFCDSYAELKNKNGKLTAKIKLLPKRIKTLSYTVKVNGGDYVESLDGKVGGVTTNCRKVYVRNTLTKTQQNELVEVLKTYTLSNHKKLANVEIINEVYSQVLGQSTNLTGSYSDIIFTVYKKLQENAYDVDSNGKYFDLIPPSIYGGRLVKTSALFDGYRTRLVYPQQLIVGDVIMCKEKNAIENYETYVFAGDKLYQIDGDSVTEKSIDILETLNAYDLFTVLRPSMGL